MSDVTESGKNDIKDDPYCAICWTKLPVSKIGVPSMDCHTEDISGRSHEAVWCEDCYEKCNLDTISKHIEDCAKVGKNHEDRHKYRNCVNQSMLNFLMKSFSVISNVSHMTS